MAVLPPDPVFRFKAEMGYLHCLCFVDGDIGEVEAVATAAGDSTNDTTNKTNGPKLLMAAGENGIVYFWDLEKNRLKFKQQLGNSIQALHSYKSEVIVQEKEGLITIYRPIVRKDLQPDIQPTLQSGYERVTSMPCALSFCKSIRFGSDRLLIPQDQATILIFDLETKTTLKQIHYTTCATSKANHCRQHKDLSVADLGQMMCLEQACINQQELIFAGFESGDIFAWNSASDELVTHAKFQECLISLTFDAWNMRGVCGGSSNSLQVFTIDKQLNMALKCEMALLNEGCQLVKVRPDRKVFVCGGFDGRVRIYSWKTLRVLAVLSEHRASITDVQFTTDKVSYWQSRIMAVAGADGVITLWNLYN